MLERLHAIGWALQLDPGWSQPFFADRRTVSMRQFLGLIIRLRMALLLSIEVA